MNTIYTAHLKNHPVRFVLKDGVLHISRSDFDAVASTCFVGGDEAVVKRVLDGGFRKLGVSEDVRSSVVGDDEIGAVVHWHLAGTVLHSMNEFGREQGGVYRETGVNALNLCMDLIALSRKANEYFGVDDAAVIYGVLERIERVAPPINVVVTEHDGWYVAECDDLHLVTEAQSMEELAERAWELVPDLIELNGLDIDPHNVRLSFNLLQEAPSQRMAN